MRSLKDLLVIELQDLHSAETQLHDSLRRMIEAARSDRLRRVLEPHREETRIQVKRLERALALLGAVPTDDVCEAMDGIVAQAEELMEDDLAGEVFDAALAVTALKVEHFEIATYGALLSIAETLEAHEVADLLRASLDEERGAAAAIAQAANDDVNLRAARPAAPAEQDP
ncbi:MAG TPA: DUF892 family protein [Acetobacteraceae bacterium]|nr:DUF892 family protein [Acetobacteraceae bacterium]